MGPWTLKPGLLLCKSYLYLNWMTLYALSFTTYVLFFFEHSVIFDAFDTKFLNSCSLINHHRLMHPSVKKYLCERHLKFIGLEFSWLLLDGPHNWKCSPVDRSVNQFSPSIRFSCSASPFLSHWILMKQKTPTTSLCPRLRGVFPCFSRTVTVSCEGSEGSPCLPRDRSRGQHSADLAILCRLGAQRRTVLPLSQLKILRCIVNVARRKSARSSSYLLGRIWIF